MKKYTVCHSVAAGPAAAKSKVMESSSLLKLGLDIHREKFVVLAQYDQATPRPPQRFAPVQFLPWVQARLDEGFEVHVVYESCGLGYGLYRALLKAGAHCYVIAPQKLDERNTRVKTDGRDGPALCLRLDRYLAGNKDSLAVIRVPSQEEERVQYWSRQREQLVHHRRKMEAQGCSLLISDGLPAPGRWWRPQNWNRLAKLLPTWILPHLELYRPALLAIDQQVRALTLELEKAAPATLPAGVGALTSVVISREICNRQRFKNRRQVSSYTGLCPGEYSSGTKRVTRFGHKAWNWQAAGHSGRTGMAHGAFSAPISPGAQAARRSGKRSPSYRVAAQEAHCRRGSSTRCGPLEAPYRTPHAGVPRI